MNSIKKSQNNHIKNCGLSLLLCFSFLPSYAQLVFYSNSESVKALNTPLNENYLSLNRATGQVYFSREKAGVNKRTKSKETAIWLQEEDSAFNVTPPDKYFYSPMGTTYDGQQLLLNRVYFERGRYYGEVLISKNDDLGHAKKLKIPFFDPMSSIQTGSISADGKFLILSFEKKAGYGVEDIYVSKNENGEWTEPQSLGYTINTKFQEISPFLADDNKTLIFATNGRNGYGSFDLYVSTRLDDSWRNWSEPQNLGAKVNTKGAETSMVFKSGESYAYFVSTTDSDGYGDIKRIKIQADIEAVEKEADVILVAEAKPSNRMFFVLKDVKTNQKIGANGVFISGKDSVFLRPTDSGLELIQTENMKDGLVEFKLAGYLSQVYPIRNINFLRGTTFVEISLEPLSEGNIITLQNVLFHRGTANFIEGSQGELDLLSEMLQENPDVKIYLRGHTDNVGDQRLNKKLSEQRVISVENYLFKKGISRNRIDGEGFGGSQPKFANEKEETRKLNRRVEFEIIRD